MKKWTHKVDIDSVSEGSFTVFRSGQDYLVLDGFGEVESHGEFEESWEEYLQRVERSGERFKVTKLNLKMENK